MSSKRVANEWSDGAQEQVSNESSITNERRTRSERAPNLQRISGEREAHKQRTSFERVPNELRMSSKCVANKWSDGAQEQVSNESSITKLSLPQTVLESLPVLVFEEYSSWYHKQLNQVYAKTGLHLEGHAALKRVHIMYGNEVQLYCARDLKHCIHYGVDAARLTQFINEAQGIPGVQVILYERNKSYMDPEDDFLHIINPNMP